MIVSKIKDLSITYLDYNTCVTNFKFSYSFGELVTQAHHISEFNKIQIHFFSPSFNQSHFWASELRYPISSILVDIFTISVFIKKINK